MRRFGAVLLAGLVLTAAFYAGGATLGYRAALARLEVRGEAALTLAVDRLESQLDQYRYLPAVMARHPAVTGVLTADDPAGVANRLLERVADTTGASDIYVMALDGETIASSNWLQERSFIGQNFAWRPYFQRAILGGLGYYHAVGTTSGRRGFYFAHPVRAEDDAIIGAIAVKLDLERIESEWRGDAEAAFFSDARGVIFLSNRDELVLKSLDPRGVGGFETEADRLQYADLAPEPLPGDPEGRWGGHRLWALEGAIGGLPQALWLSRDVKTLNLTGHVLVNLSEARWQSALWGWLSAAVGALVLLIAGEVWARRNRLRRRLDAEAQAKQMLEDQVRARTRELSAANDLLRGEIGERAAAEARLRDVQEQLVQAGKLKALGEMSAGISHELNQPLAAIQTLADNTQILMDRGREADVRKNLTSVSSLAQRAARIIRNLRAFARKEEEAGTVVDMTGIVSEALELAEPRLRKADVQVHWDAATPPAPVLGGSVRLQQVLLNLLSNAADAMAEHNGRREVTVRLREDAGQVRVVVEDTGPGLVAADRIFDPFYTTKTVGEGLGLGLSISYGIVRSFGGDLRGETREDGGARFTITLPSVQQVAA